MTADGQPGGPTTTPVSVPRTNHYLLAVATAGLLALTAVSPGVLRSSGAGETASPRPDPGITVHPVRGTSVVIETPEGVVYSDPTGGGARYAGLPAPDVVLVSRRHHEHYDAATLEEVVAPHTRLVVPAHLEGRLPGSLRHQAAPLAHGERVALGWITVTRQQRAKGHGYVATVGRHRLHVSGSTVTAPVVLDVADDLVLETR